MVCFHLNERSYDIDIFILKVIWLNSLSDIAITTQQYASSGINLLIFVHKASK